MKQNISCIQPLRLALLAVLIVAGNLPLWANDSGVAFNIRFFDRRVYHVDEGPILVQVTITNNNPAPFRFKLADERAFSIDFGVKTAANRPMEAAVSLIRLRSESRQVFFREISLAVGESFSFVEDLRDYAAFTASGMYVVQARLFPELIQSATPTAQSGAMWQPAPVRTTPASIAPGAILAAAGSPLESNRLSLSVRPPLVMGADGIPLELDVATSAVLVRDRLPPDDVVSYTITALQRGQWERFFLYLDVEAMLTRDGYRRRQWLAESEEGRQRMVTRYRQDLQNAVVDEAISQIPLLFVIERTMHTGSEGTVTTMQYFREGNFIQKKRYEWFLERRGEIWTIVGFSVTLFGAVDSLPTQP
ncbi:MAG: hypothetical protein FWD91_06565 [Treponema sp.]|nr:hypothetical protein [Treponema sp.]